MPSLFPLLSLVLLVSLFLAPARASAAVPGEFYKSLTDDGAWTWFNDPRAVYYEGAHRRTYAGWINRAGDVMMGAYDHDDSSITTFTLKSAFQKDDHDNPGFVARPDGRLFALYAYHNGRKYFRIMTQPEDTTAWSAEQAFPSNVPASSALWTYSNPFRLSAEGGRIYTHWRAGNWKPSIAWSDDGGTSWSAGYTFISSTTSTAVRPYMKYVSNGVNRIHYAFTNGHPRDEPTNSIYHLYYENGAFYKMDGSKVRDMAQIMAGNSIPHAEADMVYSAASAGLGKAWIWDIALDASGNPVIAYVVFPTNLDHHYRYASWDGAQWLDHEITPAGGGWFPQTPPATVEPEPNYSAGVVLDHQDPSGAYLSRKTQGIWEIEKWITSDHGQTWTSTPITANSSKMNVRPFLAWDGPAGQRRLLWMHGDYVHYTNYNMAIKMDIVDLLPGPHGEVSLQPFGAGRPGMPYATTVTLFNHGDQDLVLDAITPHTGSFPGDQLTIDASGLTLPGQHLTPGAVVRCVVTWIPGPQPGTRDAWLAFASNDPALDRIALGGSVKDIRENMVVYFTFDESSGTIVYDHSGSANINDGDVVGEDMAGARRSGLIGGAYHSDASTDTNFVVIDNAPGNAALDASARSDLMFGNAASGTDFSWAVWTRFFSQPVGNEIIMGNTDFVPNDQRSGASFFRNAAQYFARMNAGAFASASPQQTVTLTTGTWHHFAGTFDRNGQAIFYINGQQAGVASCSAAGTGTVGLANIPWVIGNQPDLADTLLTPVVADFDDLGIWRRALGPDEVASIYERGLQGLPLDKYPNTSPTLQQYVNHLQIAAGASTQTALAAIADIEQSSATLAIALLTTPPAGLSATVSNQSGILIFDLAAQAGLPPSSIPLTIRITDQEGAFADLQIIVEILPGNAIPGPAPYWRLY
ncbi:MAG: BNR-4 repeat-containing protein [Candidatus Sumerlaeota bacterium]|nr:BNR-4 repeat-containing protein [Candidatus Sumerlaeota bacterium]